MVSFLVFEGPTCTKSIVCMIFYFTGSTMTYNAFNREVTGGNYDNTTGTLTILDNYYDPVGSVDIANKRISGIIGGFPFTLNYQGSV